MPPTLTAPDPDAKIPFPPEAEAKLKEPLRTYHQNIGLKWGDLWRMGAWGKRTGPQGEFEKPAHENPNLRDIEIQEMYSIAEAFKVWLDKKGGGAEKWDYHEGGYPFACCSCTCCAVATMPRKNKGPKTDEVNLT